MPNYRSDQFSIGLSVAGLAGGATLDNVPWDSCEGFENVVESQEYLPGGMRPQQALGGIPKRGPGTLKRIWSDALINVFKQLDAGAGNAPATVTVQTLNAKKEPTGIPITYTGVLGTVTRPNYGSETAEKAFLQVQVSSDGELA